MEKRFNRLKILSLVLAVVSLFVMFGMYSRIRTQQKHIDMLSKCVMLQPGK